MDPCVMLLGHQCDILAKTTKIGTPANKGGGGFGGGGGAGATVQIRTSVSPPCCIDYLQIQATCL